MASMSLYRRILGARFEALPEVLRKFHDEPAGGRAHGTYRIERGAGRKRNAVASILGMPEAGTDVPIRLHVIVEGDRERWVRFFDAHRVETVQWMRGNLLMEAFGSVTFSSELVIDGSCLQYVFRRAWFAGIPLHRALSPSVDGSVNASDHGWRVSVRIFAPFLGELVHYEGWIEPE
jgi:hypothetical protein